MTLPPLESSPVVLLRWTAKARESDIIPIVIKELEQNELIVLPTKASDTLLLTASQDTLEKQATHEGLIKRRQISPHEFIMDRFSVKQRDQFRSSSRNLDSLGLFSVHERCHLVVTLLEQVKLQRDSLLRRKLTDNGHFGSTFNLRYLLLSNKWIETLTPLHLDNQKHLVHQQTWYPLWRVMPPIDDIQDYCGPAIAYYFAFMGFLGQWLGYLGILGLTSYLFRLYREDTIDEDEYTPFYGLVCFLWAVLLIRFWERQENILAYNWGTLEISTMIDDFEADYSLEGVDMEHRRPEFKGKLIVSPVTGQDEFFYPQWKRKIQYFISGVVTVGMLAAAFFVMILSLNLQGYIRPRRNGGYHPFHYPILALHSESGEIFDAKSSWKCLIPVVIHAMCILSLNAIYKTVARKLTDWENHSSQTSYDNSFILKRFLFEAFDCYVVLFYLAFFERDVERLRVELVAIFNIDSFRRIFMEVIVPVLLHSRDRRDNVHPHDLDLDEYESFDDFMEIMIQFGYVTLFASAYPLASLVMLVAVLIEIRSDIYKLTYLCQKPAGARIKDLGMWKSLLRFMVWFCCLTNCLLFGFTSDQMMHYVPSLYVRDDLGDTHLHDKGWVAILIIFCLERALIYLGLVLHAMVPVLPETLVIKLKRRKYLLYLYAHKKLE